MDSRNYKGSSLPSRVEADGDIASRIPVLGLHLDAVDGGTYCKGEMDMCISGNMDSGISSFRSMGYHSGISETGIEQFSSDLQETEQQIQNLSLSSQPRYTSSENFTQLETQQSIDEGIESCPSTELVYQETSDAQLCRQQQLWSIFAPDEEGDTQLHIAIIQGLAVSNVLVRLAESAPEFLNIQNLLGQSALHLAVLTQQPTLTRLLVVRGAALDVRDRHGNTALHLACRDGNLHCIHALLAPLNCEELTQAHVNCLTAFPQDLNIKNYDGETCLHMAVSFKQEKAISYLVHYAKADVDLRDGRSGRTVLHYAIEQGDLNLVRFLVETCSADVNAQTFDGATPLRLAVGRRHNNLTSYLLKQGADTSSLNMDAQEYEESDDDSMDDIHIAGKPFRILSG